MSMWGIGQMIEGRETFLPPCPSVECAATGCDCMIEDHHNPGACGQSPSGMTIKCQRPDGHDGQHRHEDEHALTTWEPRNHYAETARAWGDEAERMFGGHDF